jgi:hypothetical protein
MEEGTPKAGGVILPGRFAFGSTKQLITQKRFKKRDNEKRRLKVLTEQKVQLPTEAVDINVGHRVREIGRRYFNCHGYKKKKCGC